MVTRIKFLLLNDLMFGEWAVFQNFYRSVSDMLLQASVGVRCVFRVKLFWKVFFNPLVSSSLMYSGYAPCFVMPLTHCRWVF